MKEGEAHLPSQFSGSSRLPQNFGSIDADLVHLNSHEAGGHSRNLQSNTQRGLEQSEASNSAMPDHGQAPLYSRSAFLTERKEPHRTLTWSCEPEGHAHKAPSRSSGQQSRVSKSSSMMKIDDCAICFENIDENAMIKVLQPCNHYFHNVCINQWLIIEKRCPMCMQCLGAQQNS
jgi:hypothetical protein